MITAENFYWIVHDNLLRPCNIDCRYFYPFGTMDNMSRNEFNKLRRVKLDLFAIFYDQEPLYENSLPKLEEHIFTDHYSMFKSVKILANSEHSAMKSEFCRSRDVLDWYFFYHGFISLDWFRSCNSIKTDHDLKNSFLFLSHLVSKKRSYRMNLLSKLVEHGCVEKGSISFHGSKSDCLDEIQDPFTELSKKAQTSIRRNLIDSDLRLPLTAESSYVDATFSARLGSHEYKLWQESLFHIVAETVFYDHKLHLTEKIFKPIVAKRPFILVAAPGNLAYLKRYGFRTFDQWIDESYDGIEDNDARLDHIANEITKLSKMSLSQLRSMHGEMQKILEFNKRHFFGDFKRIIVDEMVDNFETCLKLWNNGRVNYRCPSHPDLQQVKEILYQ